MGPGVKEEFSPHLGLGGLLPACGLQCQKSLIWGKLSRELGVVVSFDRGREVQSMLAKAYVEVLLKEGLQKQNIRIEEGLWMDVRYL